MGYSDVMDFWFVHSKPAQWWRVDAAFDALIARRFAATHAAAVRGELAAWRGAPEGRLAEVIVLDQFSRNLFRGTAKAFAADGLALTCARDAIAAGAAAALPPTQRAFLYMPFMHSERLADHDEALQLFAEPGLESNLDFERRHRAIIERFGRYPHRNAALGRISSDDELAFLQTPGSSF